MAVSERHDLQVDDEILDSATRSDFRIAASPEHLNAEPVTTSEAPKRAAVGSRMSTQVQETRRKSVGADDGVVIARNEDTPCKQGVFVKGSGRSRTDDDGFAIRCLSHLATEPTSTLIWARS